MKTLFSFLSVWLKTLSTLGRMVKDIVFCLLVVCSVLVLSWAWRIFNWLWLKPKKMEKYLREQGIRGTPYRFLYGDTKEIASMTKKERSKPMELSHRIVPRTFPFPHKMVDRYGKIFVSWHGPTPKVTIMDPELIREILSSSKFQDFSTTKTPNPLAQTLAKGLAKCHGEKWVKHRRIITPAFHLEKLKMMLPAFQTCLCELIGRWQQLVTKEPLELDVWPDLQNLTADVISRTAFGSCYEDGRRIFQLQTEQAALVIQVLQSIYIPGTWFLPTKRNKRLKETYREVGMILRNIINMRQKAMDLGEDSKKDLLGLLMESNFNEIKHGGNAKNAGMSIDDIIEECKLFYFAGKETTSSLIVWTMISLSMHPEWQETARAEVAQVFGTRKPYFQGLNQLKIVTMILYEVLRLYSPLPTLTRTTYKEIKVGKFSLPPGVQISLPTILVHHDHELWGNDVEEFNPERFSGGVLKATKNQASFFPFGWGPRVCIGQAFALIEAKITLVMILQNFSFELSTAYIHAPYQIVAIQPQHGAQLLLRKLDLNCDT